MEESMFDCEDTPLEKKFKQSLLDISEKYFPGTIPKIKEKYPELWQAIKQAEEEMEKFWVPWNAAFEDWKSLLNEAITICQHEEPKQE
jgi:hypothetical protein